VNARAVAALAVVFNTIAWVAYFVTDETPAAVLVRLAYASSIAAAAAVVVYAVLYLIDRR
jgi:hypothetical protein